MKKFIFILCITQFSLAQVGINTTNPDALLQIKASNEANPSATDGILVPKIDTFPATNPTAAQQGMLVYLKNTIGTNLPGFYYWDDATTSWKSVTTKPDVDFLTVGTNQTPMNTTDNKYTFGNNGIGIDTPLFPLHVKGRAALGQNFDTKGQLTFFPGNGGAWFHLENKNSGKFGLSHGGTPGAFDLMTWDISGATGIGTSNPTNTLHVVGSVRFENGTQANGRVLTSDANGVATWQNTNLSNAWQLSGNTINPVTQFLGSTNNADVVLKRNNIFSGYLNDSGRNTSFGVNSTQTGFQNTAIGYAALSANTTGNYNTALGSDALASNTTATNNVAIGSEALRDNTTGIQNIAIGYRSLYENVTAQDNIAVGTGAQYNNVSGGSNIAIGSQSLYGSTNQNNNIAIGRQALTSLVGGSQNVVMGNLAGFASINSSNNVMIGHNSGRFSTGSNNVFLGHQSGYNSMDSNRLYIDNSGSVDPLIYGEFDNRVLKVNGELKINNTATTNNEAILKNEDQYSHFTDNNLDFGNGLNDFLLASKENSTETAGIRGDGDNVTIWAPADGGRLVRFLDEDLWIDSNGNPYDNGAERAYIDQNGQYFQVSDENKKKDIVPLSNAAQKVSSISGYTYTYIISEEERQKQVEPKRSAGVLAQEIAKIVPEAVESNDSNELFVNYSALIALLIEANKEQQNTIIELQKRVENLENKE